MPDYAIRKGIIFLSICICIFSLYLFFWPIDADPEAWTPAEAPCLCGIYEPNNYLAAVEKLGKGIASGPEDVDLDSKGRIYGSMADGRIIRFSRDGKEHEIFANTGGRPLGIVFDAVDNLIVADAYKGLLSIAQNGKITVLATEADNKPFAFTDGVDIAKDGTIYFTDASYKYHFDQYKKCGLEHKAQGRLLAYYPQIKKTKVLADNIYLANGVAVSSDQSFVLVNETIKYRIRRYWLKGPSKGTLEIFVDNLPGMPDNISCNGKDVFWVALPSVRDWRIDKVLPYPFIRKIGMRIPDMFYPDIKPYSFVLGIDLNGKVIYNLQDPAAGYKTITGIKQKGSQLYLGSLHEDSIGRIAVPK